MGTKPAKGPERGACNTELCGGPNPVGGAVAGINAAAARGEFAFAAKMSRILLERFPSSSHLLQTRADMCFLLGKYDEAEKYAAAALALSPRDGYLKVLLSRIRTVRAAACGSTSGRLPGDGALQDVVLSGIYTKIFRKLFSEGSYARAFQVAEALLNIRPPQDYQIIHALNCPLGTEAAYDADLKARHLSGLAEAPVPAAFHVWKDYYLEFLSDGCSIKRTVRPKARAIAERWILGRKQRYGWMLVNYARRYIFNSPPDYPKAAEMLKASMVSSPYSWETQCRLGEIELCMGRTVSGLGRFEHALRKVPREFHVQVRIWRGELRLLLGDYKSALEDLEAGDADGVPYAACWKACALMKLGALPEALRVVSKEVASRPLDLEALVIKGEVLRLMNRPAAALACLDKAISGDLPCKNNASWAHLNRALILLGKGRTDAARESLSKVSKRYLAYAARALSLPAVPKLLSASAARGMAELLLRKANGFRRDEEYLDPVWMKRVTQPLAGE